MSERSRSGRALDYLKQDVRYATRQLKRAPLFATIAALSLGMGIAVSVTVFSIVNAMLFKPLPVSDPGGLVEIYTSDRGGGENYSTASYADLKDFQATGAFTHLTAAYVTLGTLSVTDFPPERSAISFVTPDFFQVVGAQLQEGRPFAAGGTASEIIISDQYRARFFEEGESAIGATVRVGGVPFTIIGVAPRHFQGLRAQSVSAWLPEPAWAAISGVIYNPYGERGDRWWAVAGRLAPGVTKDAAETRLNVAARQLAQLYPKSWVDLTRAPLRISVLGPREAMLKTDGRDLAVAVGAMSALAGMVLVLACANVAGLLLTRAVSRRHEVAVRLTLGAGRSRLMSQLLTESLILSAIGGFVGFLGAQLVLQLARQSRTLSAFDLTPDWRVLAATTIACVCCALLFGFTPAAFTLKTEVKSGLTGHGVVGERGSVRGRLMALQVCLSFILIVLGFTASRGIRSQLHVAPGFDVDGLLVADIATFARDTAGTGAYMRAAVEDLRDIPGVLRVTITERVPTQDVPGGDVMVSGAGTPMRAGLEVVDPELFTTLGVRISSGVVPASAGRTQDIPMVVVNRALAAGAGRELVGSMLRLGDGRDVRVVAIAADVMHNASERTAGPYIYELRSGPPDAGGELFVVARVQPGTEAATTAEFGRRMRMRYPDRILPPISTLRSRLENTLAPQRYIARLAFGVGAAELALAALGLYAILLYATVTRTREIGLRMALGARPGRASLAVMTGGLQFVLGGAAVGAALSIPAAVLASRSFAGVSAGDPIPYIAAATGILLAAAAASFVPARQAARVQPMEALRHE